MLVYTEISSISCCSLNMHKHKFLLVIQIMWTVLCLLSEANSSSKKPFWPSSFLMLRLNRALDSFFSLRPQLLCPHPSDTKDLHFCTVSCFSF